MKMPWEAQDVTPPAITVIPALRPELVKNPVTGLYPGEHNGIPGFLRRVRMPDGSVRIGTENVK